MAGEQTNTNEYIAQAVAKEQDWQSKPWPWLAQQEQKTQGPE